MPASVGNTIQFNDSCSDRFQGRRARVKEVAANRVYVEIIGPPIYGYTELWTRHDSHFVVASTPREQAIYDYIREELGG